mmetsp:Transcript_104237/g.334378  ORF Transcript_104237/g.334378 Transcript_104237/m.334378 type:complete len:165 (+) Transcript_104237:62-556(+)
MPRSDDSSSPSRRRGPRGRSESRGRSKRSPPRRSSPKRRSSSRDNRQRSHPRKSPARSRSRSNSRAKDEPVRKRDGDGAGSAGDGEEPTVEIVEATKRANGDSASQALINIKGIGGRIRTLRGPPRVSKSDAERDGDNMKDAYMTGGLDKLRKLQMTMRGERIF